MHFNFNNRMGIGYFILNDKSLLDFYLGSLLIIMFEQELHNLPNSYYYI